MLENITMFEEYKPENSLKIIFPDNEEIRNYWTDLRRLKYIKFANLADEIVETIDVLYPGLRVKVVETNNSANFPFGVVSSRLPVFCFISFYPSIDLYDELRGYLIALRHTFLAKEEAQDIFLYLIHPTTRITETI